VSAAIVDGGPTPEGCARRLQTVLQVRERERDVERERDRERERKREREREREG
jgi:hypothetical protein